MADQPPPAPAPAHDLGSGKTRIFLNAFDMFTPGHLAPGQWKRPGDRSGEKHTLAYWTDLAQTLERGDITALFLADTYGGHDVYGGSVDECVRRAEQWPVLDPNIPISAMAAVTKNLGFGITASTSFEPPFLLAKRFSTLDHLTRGRVAWNIVTSWKPSAFRAIGLADTLPHDQRYAQAEEYLRLAYKLWEGSWADDAVVRDGAADTFADPARVRTIRHAGRYYRLTSKHIVDPSPQRTPFLFQAGASDAGAAFAARHAEAVFVSGPTVPAVRARVDRIRALAAAGGRDPRSLRFFRLLTPVLGRTDAEAQAKLASLRETASAVGGLVLVSSFLGADLGALPPDQVVRPGDGSGVPDAVFRAVDALAGGPGTEWTPRKIGAAASIGGLGPVVVGSPATVADELERWARGADLDGFNLVYATTPGTFEDVVDLLVPELRRRGIYPPAPASDAAPQTVRERHLGPGQAHLPAHHTGSAYKYDVYQEEAPYEDEAGEKAETAEATGEKAETAEVTEDKTEKVEK